MSTGKQVIIYIFFYQDHFPTVNKIFEQIPRMFELVPKPSTILIEIQKLLTFSGTTYIHKELSEDIEYTSRGLKIESKHLIWNGVSLMKREMFRCINYDNYVSMIFLVTC